MISVPGWNSGVQRGDDFLDLFIAWGFEGASVFAIKVQDLAAGGLHARWVAAGVNPEHLAFRNSQGHLLLGGLEIVTASFICLFGGLLECRSQEVRVVVRQLVDNGSRRLGRRGLADGHFPAQALDKFGRGALGQVAIRFVAVRFQVPELLPGRWFVFPVHAKSFRWLSGAFYAFYGLMP